MTVSGLTEVIGNSARNVFTGITNNVFYGLGGDDLFRSAAGNDSWFVGGSGADRYEVNTNAFVVI